VTVIFRNDLCCGGMTVADRAQGACNIGTHALLAKTPQAVNEHNLNKF